MSKKPNYTKDQRRLALAFEHGALYGASTALVADYMIASTVSREGSRANARMKKPIYSFTRAEVEFLEREIFPK